MLDNKMFYRDQPNFDSIISDLKILELKLNGK
jgi:hypothetical protein